MYRVQADALPTSSREWDRFVESQGDATLGHAAAWPGVLARAYGLAPCALEARGPDGSLAGVLPLAVFRSWRGERSLVSLPFLDTSGPLAGCEQAEAALLEAALEQTRRRSASALELRQAGAGVGADGEPAPRVNLSLALEDDEEGQWKALPAKVRNQTRKATRAEVSLREAPVERLLDEFYEVFCINMRDLGSPAHGRSFFAAASDAFGERLRFVVGCRAGRPIAGLVAIHYAGAVSVPWASTLRSERAHCPNNLIYWEAIRWAVSLGARRFDFGRSPVDSGTYRFKRGWKAEPTPLLWRRLAADGSPAPLAPAGDSPLLKGVSRLWTRAPLGLTTRLGPRLRRFLAE